MLIHSTKLIVSEKNQLAAFYQNDVLEDLHISHSKYQMGSIYVGKVERLVPNINAAFIRLDKSEKKGFIQLGTQPKLNPKTSKPISIEKENKILVQIVKEPTRTKGPSVTTNIGIIGQYLILLPFGKGIRLSKNLGNVKEKLHLKALLHLLKPLSMGLLVRKEAYQQNDSNLIEEFVRLKKKWVVLKCQSKKALNPYLVAENTYFIKKAVRSFYTQKLTRIIVDSRLGAWKVYKALLEGKQSSPVPKVEVIYYKSPYVSLIKHFHLDSTFHSLLQPRINLRHGGSIVIEKTEALTAIDINTGSFKLLTNSKATLLWINCEAATEIARQLKLRNIGGIIVIDFIDMKSQKDQMILLNHLSQVLKPDRGKPKIIQLSEIGLIELTRKREGQNIYDIFGKTCESCNGIGHYTNLLKLDSEIQTTTFRFGITSLYSNSTVL